MSNLQTYSDYCKEFINNNLDDCENQNIYAHDLANEITQYINIDGSATYSTYKAKEYLKFWWDDAADYYQYEIDNFGKKHT